MDRDRLRLTTPEGLTLDLPLAGPGSRGLAAFLDLLIQGLALLGLWLIVLRGRTNASTVGLLVLITAVFLPGYHVLFETRASGQTPGKRAMGLRVTSLEGGSIPLGPSLTRNTLRLVDLLPGVYTIGAIAIFATRHNQRIGDVVAGTVVLLEPKTQASATNATPPPPPFPGRAPKSTWDVTDVTAEEVAVIRSFLERRSQLDDASRNRLTNQLAERIRARVHVGSDRPTNPQLLETVVRLKSADG